MSKRTKPVQRKRTEKIPQTYRNRTLGVALTIGIVGGIAFFAGYPEIAKGAAFGAFLFGLNVLIDWLTGERHV